MYIYMNIYLYMYEHIFLYTRVFIYIYTLKEVRYPCRKNTLVAPSSPLGGDNM